MPTDLSTPTELPQPDPARTRRRVLVWAQFALLAFFGIHYLAGASDERDVAVPPARSFAPSRIYDLQEAAEMSGPWGELEVVPMFIQPPLSLVTSHTVVKDVVWRFSATTLEDVEAGYRAAGLSSADLEVLRAASVVEAESIVTMPPSDWLVGLDADLRARLYAFLNSRDAYTFSRNPYRFRGRDFDLWTKRSGLAADTLELLRKLVYREAASIAIADTPIIQDRVPSADERRRIHRTLSRTDSLSVHLVVDEGQDVEPLVAYWGERGREETVAALLEPLAMQPGGGRIDIVYLLPEFARARLNSYLPIIEFLVPDGALETRDCKWATFNFFNEAADERFGGDEVPDLARAMTHRVRAPTRFGDIILMLNRDGAIVHACVQVAGDIVFTKNGEAAINPFVLSLLEDVRDLYAVEGAVEEVYLRLAVEGVTQKHANR